MKRIRTPHVIRSPKITERLLLAVASDLHSGEYEDVMADFARCDAILLPGDLVDRHRGDNRKAERFLAEAPKVAPVFYAVGNHERKFRDREAWMRRVRDSGVTLLDDESCLFRGIRIGGLSSRQERTPNLAFLDRFEREQGFRLLMCHHPEIWRDFVRGRDIDFTVCGHAHGGQIQIRGRGLYAPGQGLFPRLTHGLHDGGKMMISRGMTNSAQLRIPRFGNPCELILLELLPETETAFEQRKGEEKP